MKRSKRTLMAIVAVFLTTGAVWLTNREAAPPKATWDDVVTEARLGGYRLIDTEKLWQRYQSDRKSLLIVDTRQAWEYRTGHIQGAVSFPMEPTKWARWRKKGALGKFLRTDKERAIVFY